MFCPNCGTETQNQIKFCKSCGLKLVDHVRLLDKPKELEEVNAKERLLREGTQALVGSFIIALVLALTFGAGLLFNPNLRQTNFALLSLMFLLTPLFPGLIGIVNLVRAGFFKNFRAQQLQAQLERLQKNQQELQAKQQPAISEPSAFASPIETVSVTESTTRELRVPIETRNRIKE